MNHEHQNEPVHPLRSMLRAYGLKQNEFAVLAGTSGVAVSQYLCGHTEHTPEKIRRAVEAHFGVTGASLEEANQEWRAEYKQWLLNGRV